MNDREFALRMKNSAPEVPAAFHAAMTNTLNSIVTKEASAPARQRAPRGMRRALALALIAALLLGAAAYAAVRWRVFDGVFGKTPENAGTIMRGDLYQTTVNNVEITIKEAGYDGMTLYLLYSYRMLDVDTPLGGEGYVTMEDLQLLQDHNVGWWVDHIWFDGQCMDMPANSGGTTSGSETPGEILEFQYWRLDNENVFLPDGTVEISLPIGEKQSLEDYYLRDHPEKFDENGNMLLPEKGIVTFELDTSVRGRVVTETPNIVADLPLLTVSVSKVVYTPILMYVTLDMNVKPEAFEAYIAENGEGFYDREGNLVYLYSGMDVIGGWALSLALVDGEGNEVFPNLREDGSFNYGNNGFGDHWTEFLFPYADSYPDTMYMAPMENGVADMSRAVRVR